MKHLVFINYEYPPLGGGGGRAMSQIASRLSSRKNQVTVITSSYKNLPRVETKDGIRIYRIPTFRRHLEKSTILEMLCFIISSFFYVPFFMKGQKVDSIVAFFTIPSGPCAWLLSKIKSAPYITSLRGGDVPGFMAGQLSIYHMLVKPFIRFLWKQSRHVVANSNGLKKLALQTMPELNIKIVPNGVDLSNLRNDKLLNIRFNDQPFIVLSVGRLNKQKSIETMLRMFFEFKKEYKNPTKLWIVGDGPERPKLEAIVIDLNLSEDVVFWGWKDQSELNHFYTQSHVFALTSINEGMPNVVLEAMTQGLPIVSFNVEGIEELVDDNINGFVLQKGDASGMKEKLLVLALNESVRQGMQIESIKKVRSYDWENITSSYERLCS